MLQKAIENPDLRTRFLAIFSDKDEDNSRSLESAIAELPGIDQLTHKPQVRNAEVGIEIVQKFEEMKLSPTLMFIDPWGYKGLSLRLVNSVLKDWGCECIFFFNYNRISMGLPNQYVQDHMEALFGADRVADLRNRLQGLSPMEREAEILESLAKALVRMGGKYVLPFRFKNATDSRTSHYLIFVSKHPLGYNIMKEIMAKESTSQDQGVASFEYLPATLRQPFLFELTRPLDDLQDLLLAGFAGQRLSMQEVFERHNVGTPYSKSNYKDALIALEAAAKITADPPCPPRRRNTFADKTTAIFPSRKER